MLISKSMSRMSLINPTASSKGDDLPAVPPPNMRTRTRRPSSAGSSPMPKFRSKSQCSPRKVQYITNVQIHLHVHVWTLHAYVHFSIHVHMYLTVYFLMYMYSMWNFSIN